VLASCLDTLLIAEDVAGRLDADGFSRDPARRVVIPSEVEGLSNRESPLMAG